MALLKNEQRMHWYVMRDLKRPNAKLPAYKQLSDEHLEVFTPMQWRLKLKNGKRIREEVPFIDRKSTRLNSSHSSQSRMPSSA